MYKRYFPEKRYKITLAFLQEHLSTQETLLDLGVENPLSEQMRALGYTVKNTAGEDLDFNQNALIDSDASVVTAFEIFEHLLNPFQILQQIQSKKIVISVPRTSKSANSRSLGSP